MAQDALKVIVDLVAEPLAWHPRMSDKVRHKMTQTGACSVPYLCSLCRRPALLDPCIAAGTPPSSALVAAQDLPQAAACIKSHKSNKVFTNIDLYKVYLI